MEAELRLKLFGGCTITLDDKLLPKLFAKHEALLAFLAVTKQAHSRQLLAGLLWGGKSETDALRNLRVNLTKVRQMVGAHLVIEHKSLAFAVETNYWLDIEAFESYIARSRLPNGRIDHNLLREAVSLYQGEFMAGFELRDASEFEEWILAQRARLQPILIQALDELVEHCVDGENYDEGIRYAYRLLEIEPWREETHQQLMWLLALDGQHSAALAQYEACSDILQRELGVEPLPETTQLYHEIQAMRQKQEMRSTRPLPPLPTPEEKTAVPFLAPPPVAYFVGRAAEIDQLWQRAVAEPEKRRYVISGLGGAGKTSLAAQFAHTLRDEFPDGVLWSHAAAADPMKIAAEWATVYGYDFSGLHHLADRTNALRHVLAGKQALLIFDDVVEAARIRPLLPTEGPALTLVTTRNANLAAALTANHIGLRELPGQNGRLLLTHLIGQERVDAESEAATAICEQLQNLPLAVTIAGRYLALRPRRQLADLVTRLRDQNQRLAALQLDDLAVRLSFLVSWQALDETQQQIFRYMGVFEGRAFTADALAAVAELQRFPAEDRLHSLVMLSLLNEEGEHHYRQHALVADFAREQLADDNASRFRMVRYFLAYAQTHRLDYQRLDAEWENLHAAIKTAFFLHQWQDVLDFTDALEPSWLANGRYTGAQNAYKWAQEAAMAREDEAKLAMILQAWGQACIEQSVYEDAKDLLEQANALFERLEDMEGIGSSKDALARIAIQQAHYETADSLLQESLVIWNALAAERGRARTLYQQARIRFERGQYGDAEQYCLDALAILETIDSPKDLILTRRLLAHVATMQGTHQMAKTQFRKAYKLASAQNDVVEATSSLYGLGGANRALGNLRQAEAQLKRSLNSFEKMGDRRSQAMALYELSWVKELQKDFATALKIGLESLALAKETADLRHTAAVLLHLGDLHKRLANLAQALTMWTEGLDIAQEIAHQSLVDALTKRIQGVS